MGQINLAPVYVTIRKQTGQAKFRHSLELWYLVYVKPCNKEMSVRGIPAGTASDTFLCDYNSAKLRCPLELVSEVGFGLVWCWFASRCISALIRVKTTVYALL